MKTRTEEVLEALEEHANTLKSDDIALYIRRKNSPGYNTPREFLPVASNVAVTSQDLLNLITHHREMQEFIRLVNQADAGLPKF